MINIYTDGSCSGNPGPGGYGIVMEWVGKNYTKEFSQGFKKTSKFSNIGIKKSNLIKLKNGQIVKHEKFGTGKVINIEGDGSNKKATVFFKKIGNKQLLLKFARLEIIK